MLMQLTENLEEKIIRALAQQPSLSVNEIKSFVDSQEHRYSKQAIYKQLKKLEQEFIIIKEKSRYMLTNAWILNLHDFVSSLYENRISGFQQKESGSSNRRRVVWKFKDLVSLHEFWVHLWISLRLNSESNEVSKWVPFPWYILVNRSRKSRLRNALRLSGQTVKICAGEDLLLSRLCLQELPTDIFSYRFNSKVSQELGEQFSGVLTLTIVGDYLMFVEGTQKLYNSVARLFRGVRVVSDVDKERIIEVLEAPNRCAIRLVQNPKLARKLRAALGGSS